MGARCACREGAISEILYEQEFPGPGFPPESFGQGGIGKWEFLSSEIEFMQLQRFTEVNDSAMIDCRTERVSNSTSLTLHVVEGVGVQVQGESLSPAPVAKVAAGIPEGRVAEHIAEGAVGPIRIWIRAWCNPSTCPSNIP